ncbi:MAG: hypothetical protein JRN07_00775 [Nitrososphaerota archaeon]|nr:hypothetical protein [Nitrososphaerota archaeon]
MGAIAFSNPRGGLGRGAVAVALILLIASASVGIYYLFQKGQGTGGAHPSGSSCVDPLGGATLTETPQGAVASYPAGDVVRTQLAPPTTIGGVTEYQLPTPIRAPNAPAVAPDGSVWFAETSVAGLAHFYPANRTLVEYPWPYDYPAPPAPGGLCGPKTSVWSVVLWNGEVWATDSGGNQLVALDPSTGMYTSVKVPTNGSFPYTLTPGPGDTLWFTELFAGKIGELSQNGTIREFPVPGGTSAYPSQIVFANSTSGYFSTVGDLEPQGGGVYSFNVGHYSPQLLGGQHLVDPTSLSLGSGALWVALHGTSSVAFYNFTTDAWSYFPTTSVFWYGSPVTTLPYFVSASGASVWTNEHYGNRMARITPANGSLVEYSESSLPTNANTIGNALTFAVGGGRAWFVEQTGNVLGYADSAYSPGFYTSVSGNTTLVVHRGASATVDLVVHDTGHRGPLRLTFSDSESYLSTPENLTFGVPSSSVSPALGGEATVPVTVSALQSLKPGEYYAILTATDGLTFESSFIRIVVPA